VEGPFKKTKASEGAAALPAAGQKKRTVQQRGKEGQAAGTSISVRKKERTVLLERPNQDYRKEGHQGGREDSLGHYHLVNLPLQRPDPFLIMASSLKPRKSRRRKRGPTKGKKELGGDLQEGGYFRRKTIINEGEASQISEEEPLPKVKQYPGRRQEKSLKKEAPLLLERAKRRTGAKDLKEKPYQKSRPG